MSAPVSVSGSALPLPAAAPTGRGGAVRSGAGGSGLRIPGIAEPGPAPAAGGDAPEPPPRSPAPHRRRSAPPCSGKPLPRSVSPPPVPAPPCSFRVVLATVGRRRWPPPLPLGPACPTGGSLPGPTMPPRPRGSPAGGFLGSWGGSRVVGSQLRPPKSSPFPPPAQPPRSQSRPWV